MQKLILFSLLFCATNLCIAQSKKNSISYNIEIDSYLTSGKLGLNGSEIMFFGDKKSDGVQQFLNSPINSFIKDGLNEVTFELDTLPSEYGGQNFTLQVLQYTGIKSKIIKEVKIKADAKFPIKQTFNFKITKPPYSGFADISKVFAIRNYQMFVESNNVHGSVKMNDVVLDTIEGVNSTTFFNLNKFAKKGQNDVIVQLSKDSLNYSFKVEVYELFPGQHSRSGKIVYQNTFSDTSSSNKDFPTNMKISLDLSKAAGSSVWEKGDDIVLTEKDRDSLDNIIETMYQLFLNKDVNKALEISKFTIEEEARGTGRTVENVTKQFRENFKSIMDIIPKGKVKKEEFTIKRMEVVGGNKFLYVYSGTGSNKVLFAKINGSWVIVE